MFSRSVSLGGILVVGISSPWDNFIFPISFTEKWTNVGDVISTQ